MSERLSLEQIIAAGLSGYHDYPECRGNCSFELRGIGPWYVSVAEGEGYWWEGAPTFRELIDAGLEAIISRKNGWDLDDVVTEDFVAADFIAAAYEICKQEKRAYEQIEDEEAAREQEEDWRHCDSFLVESPRGFANEMYCFAIEDEDDAEQAAKVVKAYSGNPNGWAEIIGFAEFSEMIRRGLQCLRQDQRAGQNPHTNPPCGITCALPFSDRARP
jgi:hypothetical protein